MINLVNSIVNRDFVSADSILEETVELIMAKKLEEAKKMTASKMCEQGLSKPSWALQQRGLVEDDVESGEESSMARSELNAITKDAKSIMSKIKGNKELEAWTQSKITKAADYLNSVADYMDEENELEESDDMGPVKARGERVKDYRHKTSGKEISSTKHPGEEWELVKEESLEEARVKIIKARIRGGKIQRRKKVSNVAGMTLRGGKLQRMSAAERRRRKMGARRAKIKRKSKMNRALMKRQRSLRKRKALGL
jgi:hypothetical protein